MSPLNFTLTHEFDFYLYVCIQVGNSGHQTHSPFNIVDKMTSYSCSGVMNGSTLTQLRTEYEDTIEGLKDEKRELVMKISAAITEKKRAEQRSCNLEEELSKTKDSLASVELSLQRFDYRQVEYCERQEPPNSEVSLNKSDMSTKSALPSTALCKSLISMENANYDEKYLSSKENVPGSSESRANTPKKEPLSPSNMSILSTRSNKSPKPSNKCSNSESKRSTSLTPCKTDLTKITMSVGENIDTNNQECTQS